MLSTMTPEGQSIPDDKRIVIVGGGTSVPIANHLSVSANAYGKTALRLHELCQEAFIRGDHRMSAELRLTRMAGGPSNLESPKDLERLIDELVADVSTRIIFWNPAVVDYTPETAIASGSPAETLLLEVEDMGKDFRFKTSTYPRLTVELHVADKLVKQIRATRKDLTLVAFKTTCGASEQEMYVAGLNLLKSASCNLVLVNDSVTRMNLIVTPEHGRYDVTTDREAALTSLVEMALLRSHLMFTRSTVVAGEAVPWSDKRVPETLRAVVNHCIEAGAYQPFRGSTVGHFAVKLSPKQFLTSRRKTNFNDLEKLGLVLVETDGEDTVTAYGHKPSVGGQSQRIIFDNHPELDSIVHFHCPLRDPINENVDWEHYSPSDRDDIPVASQRAYECGSHECGQNTMVNLKKFEVASGQYVWAVHLDKHGPNIVFRSDAVDPQAVIDFIDRNWDLSQQSNGPLVVEPQTVTG